MTSNHQIDPDSGTIDSASSTPRSDKWHECNQSRVRLMCSFGGRILPRPHDNQLRYVGGDTRIVAVDRNTKFAGLLSKLAKLSNTNDINIKYQLPNEDLDALISVTSDEDVENMVEEYDRLTTQVGVNIKTSRLRIFLFPPGGGGVSRASSISSLLGGSSKREHWFLDALNGGSASLERGRSEVSSIVSEVPDYLFGLDSSDDPKPKSRLAENVSVASDPGSPFPLTSSSPYSSTFSATGVSAIPDLPPVKTKPESQVQAEETKENRVEAEPVPVQQQPMGYAGNPVWHYVPDSHMGPTVQQMGFAGNPVYYVSAGPASEVQVRPVPVPMQYMQQVPQPPATAQIYRNPVAPVGQVYAPMVHPGEMKPLQPMEAYDYGGAMMSDGVNQQVYYAPRNPGVIPGFPTAGIAVGSELQSNCPDGKMGKPL